MTRSFSYGLIAGCISIFSAFAAQDVSTVEGFDRAFRQANGSKNFRQLEQLVWWERASSKARDDMRAVLRQEFGHPIRRIEISRFSWQEAIYPPRNPNLSPTHAFTVWWVDGRDKLGERIVGTFYTLGRKDGRFYLIVSDRWPISTTHYE